MMFLMVNVLLRPNRYKFSYSITGTFLCAIVPVYFHVYSVGAVSYVLFYSDNNTLDTFFVHKSAISIHSYCFYASLLIVFIISLD
jgi:hypothetical protein